MNPQIFHVDNIYPTFNLAQQQKSLVELFYGVYATILELKMLYHLVLLIKNIDMALKTPTDNEILKVVYDKATLALHIKFSFVPVFIILAFIYHKLIAIPLFDEKFIRAKFMYE